MTTSDAFLFCVLSVQVTSTCSINDNTWKKGTESLQRLAWVAIAPAFFGRNQGSKSGRGITSTRPFRARATHRSIDTKPPRPPLPDREPVPAPHRSLPGCPSPHRSLASLSADHILTILALRGSGGRHPRRVRRHIRLFLLLFRSACGLFYYYFLNFLFD